LTANKYRGSLVFCGKLTHQGKPISSACVEQNQPNQEYENSENFHKNRARNTQLRGDYIPKIRKINSRQFTIDSSKSKCQISPLSVQHVAAAGWDRNIDPRD